MVVVYLSVSGIDVGHVFVCQGYRCWTCIFVLGVPMLVRYLCLTVSMLVIYLCVSGIDVGHVFVC
jgi:hypothetical protein